MAGSLRIAEQHLCALQCPILCVGLRRVVGAAATASSYVMAWNISWLGFGLSDQLLLVCYPWGKVHYPLFGYLA
jgi:hypothetical protein